MKAFLRGLHKGEGRRFQCRRKRALRRPNTKPVSRNRRTHTTRGTMGRVVEEWETGGFKFQLIEHDKDDVFVKPRGDLLTDHVYTSTGYPNFVWSCCIYPTLRAEINCRDSRGAVNFSFRMNGVRMQFENGSYTYTIPAGSWYSLFAERSNGFQFDDFVRTEFTVTPASGSMYCSVSAWEY